MFHMPMSSPMTKTMLGFLSAACAATAMNAAHNVAAHLARDIAVLLPSGSRGRSCLSASIAEWSPRPHQRSIEVSCLFAPTCRRVGLRTANLQDGDVPDVDDDKRAVLLCPGRHRVLGVAHVPVRSRRDPAARALVDGPYERSGTLLGWASIHES